MIANISPSIQFLKPILEYNQRKVKKGEAKVLSVKNVFDGSEKTAEHLMLSYGEQSKRKDRYFHVSINFPKTDEILLTDQKMDRVGEQYLQKLGFPSDHPYIAYRHEDTGHPHMHLVCSKILASGKPIEDNHLHRKSQRITRELEQEHRLTPVNSEKSHLQQRLPKQPKTLKSRILLHLDLALKEKKVENLEELKTYLNTQALDVTHLKGTKPTAKGTIQYNGLVFSATDESFKQNQRGIKASKLTGSPTLSKLEKRFAQNGNFHKRRRREIQRETAYILSNYSQLNIQEFQKTQAKRGVEFRFKTDSKSNLVGVSFTDIATGKKFTGEQIGKNFTARNLAKILTLKETIILPEKRTERSIKSLKPYLSNQAVEQQLIWLTAMGFRLKLTKGNISISDYRNPPDTGFVPYLENAPITDLKSPNRYISNKKIDFNNAFFKLPSKSTGHD